MDHLLYEAREKVVQKEAVNASIIGAREGDGRKVMDYHCNLNGVRRRCCHACFLKVLNMKQNQFRNIMDTSDAGYGGFGGSDYKNCSERDRGGGEVSHADLREWLANETVNPRECPGDQEMVSNTFCVRKNVHEACHVWFQEHMECGAEQSPEGEDIYVSVPCKGDLHDMYVADMLKRGWVVEELLSKEEFLVKWRECFPHILLRRECTVIGKCGVCAQLDGEGQKKGNCPETKTALKKGKMLHRMFYSNERMSYQERTHHARGEKGVLSVCIDIMESCDFQPPSGGSQCKFEQSLDCTYVGALCHGVGLTMYRTTNLVGKSADIICHVILDQIQRYIKRNYCNPDVIYIQTDGGGENANMCVFGLLELLVHWRVAHIIIATRFATGHGHDDADGAFGHVKTAWKRMVMKTWAAFKKILEEKHEFSNLKSELVDVHCIHNYWAYFQGCFDKYLSKFQKMQETQHQFRFEAVHNDPWFPLGVKVMYTAFAYFMNVEGIVLADKAAARSDLGRKIGIDFVRTFSKWYPNEDTYESRPVSGFYLLKKIPTVALQVKPYDEADLVAMEKVRDYIVTAQKIDAGEKREWSDFFLNYLPIRGREYHPNGVKPYIPLQCFNDSPFPFRPPSERCRGLVEDKVSAEVEELTLLALAMPCVRCEWEQNPPLPRLYITKTAEVADTLERYNARVNVLIKHLRSKRDDRAEVGCTVAFMEKKLNSMTDVLGKELIARGGTRAERCKRIVPLTNAFYQWMYAPLLPEVETFMANLLTDPLHSQEELYETVKEVGNVKITRNLLRGAMNGTIVNSLFFLFQRRDNDVTQMHQRLYVNKGNMTYCPLDKSKFLTVEDGLTLLAGSMVLGNIGRLRTLYIPYLYEVSADVSVWTLIVVDCTGHSYSLVTPKTSYVDLSASHTGLLMANITLKLNAVLHVAWPTCTLYRTESLEDVDVFHIDQLSCHDSVSWLFAVTYFIVMQAPVEVVPERFVLIEKKLKYFLVHSKLFM